ncbi:hypothetical protein Tco_1083470 [Tanacetum coccineum]
MEDHEQAFVEYASSRADEAGGHAFVDYHPRHMRADAGGDASQEARLSKFEADFKQQQSEMTNKIDTMLKAITDRIAGTLPSDTVKNPKLSTYPVLSARSYLTENPQCSTQTHVPQLSNTELIVTKEEDGDVMFIEIISKDDNSCKEEPKTEGQKVKIKGMHVIVGNFTYIVDFMIIEDVSSIIDPGLSQVVLGKPFVEISNMTHDPPEGVVKFTNRNNEVAYKMPHKIEQYDSLSDLVKEHTKSVYLRNEEDKRRGLEYVMSKILGFYKECLELKPEYLTGIWMMKEKSRKDVIFDEKKLGSS